MIRGVLRRFVTQFSLPDQTRETLVSTRSAATHKDEGSEPAVSGSFKFVAGVVIADFWSQPSSTRLRTLSME